MEWLSGCNSPRTIFPFALSELEVKDDFKIFISLLAEILSLLGSTANSIIY